MPKGGSDEGKDNEILACRKNSHARLIMMMSRLILPYPLRRHSVAAVATSGILLNGGQGMPCGCPGSSNQAGPEKKQSMAV